MKKGKEKSEVYLVDDELDSFDESSGRGSCDEVLVLKKQPPPRKEQLIAHGAKEIRCACCGQIRPIAGAEELDDGWICEECYAEVAPEPRYGGQRGR